MKYAPIKFEYAENLKPYEKVVKKNIADDLLEALQLIISYHDDGNCELHSEDVAMARAAISKALGEE